MRRIYEVLGWLALGKVLAVLVLLMYLGVPDYSRRGRPILVGKSFGFILQEERPVPFEQHLVKYHLYVKVLYVNAIGTWEVRQFPRELVVEVGDLVVPTVQVDGDRR